MAKDGPDGEDKEPLQPSRMLAVIESVAISAKDARSLVRKRLLDSKRRHPTNSVYEHQDRVADQIIRRYSKMTAIAGATAALPGMIPGVGTAVAVIGGGSVDLVSTMKLQVDMCRCLAECYDHDLDSEDAKHLSMLLAFTASLEGLGTETAIKIASKAGVKMLRLYLKGAVLQTLKQMLRSIGINFTRTGLEKAFPFGVGVAVGASLNYGLTSYVGKQAKGFFHVAHEIKEEPTP